MALAWTTALATGVQSIDDQHKEIFRRASLLMEASAKGEGRSRIEETIQFLGMYVVQHFTAEEAVMARSAYPGYADHKRLHARFIEDFVALRKEYEQTGASARLVVEFQRRVVEWLLHHIGKEDRAIGVHIASRKPQPVAS